MKHTKSYLFTSRLLAVALSVIGLAEAFNGLVVLPLFCGLMALVLMTDTTERS